jgi:hypothetical protein
MSINVNITHPPDTGTTTAAFSDPPPEFTATGTVDSGPSRMAYQIDSGRLNPIDISNLDQTTGGVWTFTLTSDDCPDANYTWYSLVVYAYDSNGSYSATADFQRSA